MKKRFIRVLAWIVGSILFVWLALTLWVQQDRSAIAWHNHLAGSGRQALILYNPDPIYNLDAQLACAFSEGLKEAGWASTATSYEAFKDSVPQARDLYVIIANTYNWAPDWPTRHFVARTSWLKGKSVVAITLGSGATERSRRLLEEVLQARDVKLVDSRSFWLLRPNDDSRMEEPNVEVARGLVREWAENLVAEFPKQ